MLQKNQQSSSAKGWTYAIWIVVLAAVSIMSVGPFSLSKVRASFGAITQHAKVMDEQLEPFNGTPQTLPFSQNWTNIGMITTNDDWSGVPGIEGYFLRNDTSSTTNVDPQTLLADTFAGAEAPELDVIANQVATAISNGGVAEFHTTSQAGTPGADSVVGFQGSGTADAPFLLLSINTTGKSTINVAYNLRDIDCTTDNAAQQVALQYRIGSSGSYNNVTSGYVADATTGPSLCDLVTPVSATLPADANNQPLVQIRIMTTNAVGNDEFVGIDDIVISGITAATASVQFNAATYSGSESNSAVITVTRTGDTSGASSVTFSTVAGGTALGGSCGTADYVTTSQTVTFTTGETSKPVNVQICSDMTVESTETVNLALTNPSGGTTLGGQSTAVLNISDAASQNRNPAPITVNGGSPADLYPSTINVSGAPTNVFRIRVTLYDFLATPGNHVDVLLVGPNGAKYLLMGHVGTSASQTVPVTLTFSDAAASVLPTSTPLTGGTFLPTNCDFIDPFPAGGPAGPYVDPGCDVGRAAAETLYGTFGQQNGNGLWSLYVREEDAFSTTAVGTFLGGWGIEFLSATAADGTVSGRVVTEDGAGLRGALVTIIDSRGASKTVLTSSLGYYRFDEIETGQTYIVSVVSRRYRFTPQVLQVFDTLTEADFVAIE